MIVAFVECLNSASDRLVYVQKLSTCMLLGLIVIILVGLDHFLHECIYYSVSYDGCNGIFILNAVWLS